ncbi:MAG TPA: proline dehydrogenase family protein [Candidatus Sulfomarinibacteraceae bacterium]|nr:proline dehydrogenase family protein [Candidatus Sulfomarinibacteraceae bacterium]
MTDKNRSPFFSLLALLLVAFLLYLYAERWLRALLLYLAGADWANRLVTEFPPAWYVASRFVAGETRADAIRVARRLNEKGITTTMAYLGESITDVAEANAARDEILSMLDDISHSGVRGHVSVKLSQLGLKIDRQLTLDNMRRILERAQAHDIFVRIDMEESELVEPTLELFHILRDEHGFSNTGVVIQSYLYRSEADVRRLIGEGVSVRLCKGAYNEPPEIAFSEKAATNENFVRLAKMLLSEQARANGAYAAIATHDDEMLAATMAYARAQDIAPDAFEFQMLHGVRRPTQEALAQQGYRVRVYIPYGTAWYPYFMRRLAERPANLWFFIVNFFRH